MKNIIKKIVFIFKYLIVSLNYLVHKPKINILNDNDTLKFIKNGSSITRFGDGEIRLMLNCDSTPGFQSKNSELSNDLKEVIKSNDENLLVCLPENLINMSNKTLDSKYFWKKFICEYWSKTKCYIDPQKNYGNTNLTRFYMDYKNKNVCSEKIINIKKIWDKKNILIVEGTQTRLGVGNDLFDSCCSIKRIICPSKNAYNSIDQIYKKIINNINNIDIVLLALGPTATVLAYKLSKNNIQSLDIGHIDIEYEWYKKHAKKKILISGKYVNELGGVEKASSELDNDKKYLNEIIAEVK